MTNERKDPDEHPDDFYVTSTAPDGRFVAVVTILFGAARIGIGPARHIPYWQDIWCYESIGEAVASLERWLDTSPFAAEPEGWIRHKRTGRRRPGGDAGKEYVYR